MIFFKDSSSLLGGTVLQNIFKFANTPLASSIFADELQSIEELGFLFHNLECRSVEDTERLLVGAAVIVGVGIIEVLSRGNAIC